MYRVVPAALAILATTLPVAAQEPARSLRPPQTVTRPAVTAVVPRSAAAPTLLPGTRANVFTTIQGNALDSTNGVLPNAVVRLRDARYGRIVGSQITDRSGLFSFGPLDPGTYVVELLATDQVTVLAASQMLDVGAGEAVSAVVKLPFRIAALSGILGHSTAQAAAIVMAAAATGVLATTVTGEPASPR